MNHWGSYLDNIALVASRPKSWRLVLTSEEVRESLWGLEKTSGTSFVPALSEAVTWYVRGALVRSITSSRSLKRCSNETRRCNG